MTPEFNLNLIFDKKKYTSEFNTMEKKLYHFTIFVFDTGLPVMPRENSPHDRLKIRWKRMHPRGKVGPHSFVISSSVSVSV